MNRLLQLVAPFHCGLTGERRLIRGLHKDCEERKSESMLGKGSKQIICKKPGTIKMSFQKDTKFARASTCRMRQC